MNIVDRHGAPLVRLDEEPVITGEMAARQRAELAAEVRARVHPRTLQRHQLWRQQPQRDVADIAERVIAREEKLRRRAAAARKAGLL